MYVPHRFHNEQDLEKWFSQRFCSRWKRLCDKYRKDWKMYSQSTVMKAASLAFAYFGAATDGNSEVCMNFYDMIHGEANEVIIMDNEPVRLEDSMTAKFVIDTAALMVEEDETLQKEAQWAFDALGSHVWLAYSDDVMYAPQDVNRTPVVQKEMAKEMGATEMMKMDVSVPPIGNELAQWMLNDAIASGNPDKVTLINELIMRNSMARYHSDLWNMMQKANMTVQKANEANASVSVGAGGINIQHLDKLDR